MRTIPLTSLGKKNCSSKGLMQRSKLAILKSTISNGCYPTPEGVGSFGDC